MTVQVLLLKMVFKLSLKFIKLPHLPDAGVGGGGNKAWD